MFNNNKHQKSKKAWLYSLALLIFTLISFTSLAVVMIQNHDKLKGKDAIGAKQGIILSVSQRGENALFYIDKSAELSTDSSIISLAEKGGFSNELPCGSFLGYNLWNSPGKECYPVQIEKSLSNEISNMMSDLAFLYTIDELPSQYIVSVSDGIDISGSSITPLYLSENPIGIRSVIPTDKNNVALKTVACTDGNCIAKLAKQYAEEYKVLPYVWGGVSPFTYEATISDQKINPNSFFKGVPISKEQPKGNGKRSGLPTVPGFDCSGFVWWTLKHAGVLTHRDSAGGYYNYAKNNKWTPICVDSTCTNDYISANAKPGDIMFIHPCKERTICHIGIYAGDSKIVESAGSTGITFRDIPKTYYFGEKTGMKAIYRPVFGKAFLSQQNTQPSAAIQNQQNAQNAINQNTPVDQNAQLSVALGESPIFDAPIDGDSMIYSITPSFKFHRTYNIKDYDTLKTEAKALIKESLECENNDLGSIKSCITEKLIGKQISQDCSETIEEDTYNNFVDKTTSCIQSDLQPECICEITPIISDNNKGKSVEYLIKKTETGTSILQKIGGGEDNEYVFSGYELKDTKLNNGNLEMIPSGNYDIIFQFSATEISKAEVNGINAGKKIYVYKNGTTISLLRELDYLKGKQLNFCGIKNQRNFKFCYSGKEKFMNSNSETGLYELQNPIYRFALFFGDNIPPESPTGLFVDDLKLSENSLLIKVNKPTKAGVAIQDLDFYKIYCSNIKFSESANMPYSRKVSAKAGVLNLRLDNCNGQPIENGREYFISVSAVDKTGNEIKTEVVSLVGKSIDDLPPGIALSTVAASAGQSNIKVSWQQVTKNYDGSTIKDLAAYRVYYSNTAISSLENVQYNEFKLGEIKELTATIDTGDQENADKYIVVVVGVDKLGNVIKDVTESYENAFKKVYPANTLLI